MRTSVLRTAGFVVLFALISGIICFVCKKLSDDREALKFHEAVMNLVKEDNS